MLTNSLHRLDSDHWVHPVSSWQGHAQAGPLILERGDGVFLTDTSGKTYLDGFAGLWCVNVGYGRQSIVDAARRQMERLPYATGYFGFASEPAIRLSAKLAELTPGNLNHIFFSQGGSDAVDSAVRFINYYWTVRGEPKRRRILSVRRGYHGSTSTGSQITTLPAFHEGFGQEDRSAQYLTSPDPYRHPAGPGAEEIISASVDELENMVAGFEGEVAALFCEPVQGSGGVIVPPRGWLKAMRECCRRLGILFVVDEVITGFGRTGPLFASASEGVVPDIITMAKGLTSGYLPMGACALSDDVYETIAMGAPDGAPIGHGFTYSGHPVSAAVALEVIRLYEEEGLLANAARMGEHLSAGLAKLKDHPKVGNVRSSGLLAGIEPVSDKANKTPLPTDPKLSGRLFKAGLENGVIFRAFSDGTIGLAPALCITPDEIDRLLNGVRCSLDTL